MNTRGKVALIAIALAGVAAGQAHAQARQVVSASTTPVWKAGGSEAPQADGRASEDREPMDRASIGLRLGEAGMGIASLRSREQASASFPGAIDGRLGVRLALPIHLGGSGFGWTFEPYLSRSSVRRVVRDGAGDPDGLRRVLLAAYGLYTGPSVQLQVATPLYLGIGFGAMGSYIASDGFAYGVDLYGRVPLSLTYYVSRQLALVAEAGVGYGMSMFAAKARRATDPKTRAASIVIDRTELGQAFTWDWSFGVRLP